MMMSIGAARLCVVEERIESHEEVVKSSLRESIEIFPKGTYTAE